MEQNSSKNVEKKTFDCCCHHSSSPPSKQVAHHYLFPGSLAGPEETAQYCIFSLGEMTLARNIIQQQVTTVYPDPLGQHR